ncbi:MAG: formylmethanofuran dehydrogenase subunit E family protein [bacterium]|jgi:formylmethanofuran dehydrogenase subunit E
MAENRLLTQAGRFHGHIGPFLAIGLRMGFIANEVLGRTPMQTRAVVTVRPETPRSCVVDGIQVSSGCTMGKRNIEIEPDDDSVSVTFTRGDRCISICLRDAFLEKMETDLRGQPEKAVVDYAYGIMDTRAEDLFEVRE